MAGIANLDVINKRLLFDRHVSAMGIFFCPFYSLMIICVSHGSSVFRTLLNPSMIILFSIQVLVLSLFEHNINHVKSKLENKKDSIHLKEIKVMLSLLTITYISVVCTLQLIFKVSALELLFLLCPLYIILIITLVELTDHRQYYSFLLLTAVTVTYAMTPWSHLYAIVVLVSLGLFYGINSVVTSVSESKTSFQPHFCIKSFIYFSIFGLSLVSPLLYYFMHNESASLSLYSLIALTCVYCFYFDSNYLCLLKKLRKEYHENLPLAEYTNQSRKIAESLTKVVFVFLTICGGLVVVNFAYGHSTAPVVFIVSAMLMYNINYITKLSFIVLSLHLMLGVLLCLIDISYMYVLYLILISSIFIFKLNKFKRSLLGFY